MSRKSPNTPEGVLQLAREYSGAAERLRQQRLIVVMFVDLVGSTEFKERHPDEVEWLPWLSTFLVGVSRIISEHGRVVKYIGDEVMAVFEGDSAIMHAEHAAESILQLCAELTEYGFVPKLSLDYGRVSLLDLSMGTGKGLLREDPQGTIVDRAARIMSQCVGGAIVGSTSIANSSPRKKQWKACGAFAAKGILQPVEVFQLPFGAACPTVTVRTRLSADEAERRIAELESMISELKALRN